jgi:hypothetical protein
MTNMPIAKCEMAIRMSLDYLKMLQQSQNASYDNMTSDEILLDVESIQTTQFSRGYDINVTIKNQSNEIYDQTIYTG